MNDSIIGATNMTLDQIEAWMSQYQRYGEPPTFETRAIAGLVAELRKVRCENDQMRSILGEWVNLRPSLFVAHNRGSDWHQIVHGLLERSEEFIEGNL